MTSDDEALEASEGPGEVDVSVREERDFHPTRSALGMTLAISLGLAAFSAFASVTLLGRGELFGWIFGALALWAGSMTVAWMRRWRESRLAISLGDDGILDGTALGAPIFIPWDDIDAVVEDDAGTTLVLREDATLEIPFHRKFLGWLGRKRGREYLLPLRGLNAHHFAVSAYIREWHESLLLERVAEEKARLIDVPTAGAAEPSDGAATSAPASPDAECPSDSPSPESPSP